MMRLFTTLGLLAVVALLCAAGVLFFTDPYTDHRAAMAAQLAEVMPEEHGAAIVPDADYREYQKIIVSRAALWEPLVAPPAPMAKGIDTAKALEGIEVKKGKIGTGADAKYLIRTPAAPKGAWFKIGDAVRDNVVIKGVTAEGIEMEISESGGKATAVLAFP